MTFDNRKYVIIPTTEISKIDFDQVLETSASTLRLSVDGSLTFIKYDGDDPLFLSQIQNKSGPFSHEQMLVILESADWNPSDPLV